MAPWNIAYMIPVARNGNGFQRRTMATTNRVHLGYRVKSVVMEQRYRPAEHGSKPIPVYDARDYGDDVDEILPR